jgi:hypothetical protein
MAKEKGSFSMATGGVEQRGTGAPRGDPECGAKLTLPAAQAAAIFFSG